MLSAGSIVLALSLASPAAADTVTCSYTPAGGFLPAFVTMGITPHKGFATFIGRAGNDLVAQGENVADCGAATVTNTDLIAISDQSPDGAGNLGILYVPVGAGAVLAPGATNEPGSSDEIEIGIDLGPGRDTLGLAAQQNGAGPPVIRLGADGGKRYINLNAAEVSGVDQDVTFQGVDSIYFSGATGDPGADVRATGGGGTGPSALPVRTTMEGGTGDDRFDGGSVHDALDGAAGDDILTGNRGSDFLRGYRGDDLLRGGAGGDGLAGMQGADQLLGGPRADRLNGSVGADLLVGGGGADEALGGGGRDTVKGGAGGDELRGGSGPDRLVGGGGVDVCNGGPGNDVFVGCEITKS